MSRASVLIPAYNAERWITEAVESALHQRRGDVEVIVVDDGSTDGTVAALQAFGDRILVESGPNRGATVARNRLLELANGEWVQYLDADDYLLPHKVERQLTAIEESPETDVLYGPVTIDWHVGDRVEACLQEIPPPHDPWAQLALWQLPQTGAPIFRRQALLDIGGWREDQPCCQEHELYLRLLIAEKRLHYADTGGAVYRRFETGTLSTSKMDRVWRERLKIEDRLERHLQDQSMLTQHRQWAINQARFEIARDAWNENRPIAQAAHAAIVKTGAPFQPSGEAGPRSYRAMYRFFGFEGAERIATATRAARKKLP